jgi:ABC-type spermidine/putrescine transport system permease subunit II
VLGDSSLLGAAGNSTLIAVAVTALTALVAMPTAWAMAKFPLRWKRAVEIFQLAPVIVPGVVVATGVGQVFQVLGMAYTVTGVVLVQMVGTLPLMVRLLVASFEVLPDELLHAARSLGARPLAVAWHVVLPLSLPGLMAGGLLSFVGSFEEFDKTFIVGAPVVQTLPVLLYHHLDPYSLQFPLAAAVALILLLPVLVVFVLSGRILRDDLMAAGMGKL